MSKLNFNSSYVHLLNYIFDDMMLKRKKFLIQWRNFGLKRSCIFKVKNFSSLWPFFDFNLIFKLIFIKFSY